MTFYDHNGSAVLTVEVDDSSKRNVALLEDDMLELHFSLAVHVELPLMCYCTFEGVRYYMYSKPDVTKQHSRNFEYTVNMYTAAYQKKITMLRNVVIDYATTPYTVGGDFRLKFPLTATPREHVQMVCDCLNYATGTAEWLVDYANTLGMEASLSPTAYQDTAGNYYSDEGDEKLVTFENVFCHDALKNIADVFNTEYNVVDIEVGGQTKHLVALCNVEFNKSNPLYMSYGADKGLEGGMGRENNGTQPIDILYVTGGEQNIPEHYNQTEDTSTSPSTWTGEKSTVLLLPKRCACFYVNGKFYYRPNVTIITGQDGFEYVEEITIGGGVVPYPVYDEKGTLVTEELPIGTPCYVTSGDGRSLRQIRDEYYSRRLGGGWSYTPRDTHYEAVLDASEIYPMRIGLVDEVQLVDNIGRTTGSDEKKYYDILDADTVLGFTAGKLNYNDCSLPDETMTVIFQDGMLAGREFEIQTVGSGTDCRPNCSEKNNKYCIPLCQSEFDGVVMPSGVFVPKVGDHYAVFHCQLPTAYVSKAELEMMFKGVDYLYHNTDAFFSFSGTVYPKWAKEHWDSSYTYGSKVYANGIGEYMAVGQHLQIMDSQLFGSAGLVMRITALEQSINSPRSFELTLTNKKAVLFNWASRLAKTVRKENQSPRIIDSRSREEYYRKPTTGSALFRGSGTTSDKNYRGNILVAKINELIAAVASLNDTAVQNGLVIQECTVSKDGTPSCSQGAIPNIEPIE